MKISKKYLAISILIATPLFSVVSEKNKMKMAITSAHTRALSKDNLITKKIDLEDKNIWNSMMSEISQYVNTNASQYNSTFITLSNISNALFNTLASNYGMYVSGKTKLNTSAIFNYINTNLSQHLQQAKQITQKLDRRVIFALQKTKDVREVLHQLALSLELSIAKAINDARKLSE